jgi:hypothetical protein
MSLGIDKFVRDWMATFLSMFLGPSVLDPSAKNATAGESLARDGLKMAGRFIGTGSPLEKKLSPWIKDVVEVALDTKKTVEKPLTDPLLDALLATRASELGLTPGGPETAEARLKSAMKMASAIGLNAHVLSMILSADVVGCLDLNATGVAAMMGEASGFSELMSQVNRPLWEGYLGVPWREKLAQQLRPWRPDLNLLAQARRERELRGDIRSDLVPDTLEETLKRKGLRDEDIKLWHESVWAWPGMRQLATLLDDPHVWAAEAATKDLFDHLGYTDDVRTFARDACKLRQAGPWSTRWLNQQISNLEYGLMDYAEFRARADAVSLPEHVKTAVLRVGETAEFTAWCKAIVDRAKLAYQRAEITDQELYYELESVGMGAKRSKLVVDSERLRRMHKVWILSDVEVAREALTVYRQLFIYGLMTEASYRAALAAAQLEPEMIEERFFLDHHRRVMTVAREIREFDLPELRDALLEGRITLAAYRDRLAALEFPPELLPTEMAYVNGLVIRRDRQRVERIQLPAAERAYVKSLIVKDALRRLYLEAGRTGDEIDIRLKLLDRLRADEGRAGAGGSRSAAQRVADAEWKYIDGEIAEGELVEIYKQQGVPPDRVEARLKVLRPLRL